jgi:hypothetical protein
MGAALGSIMPTIITAHMRNISTKSTPLQGWAWAMAMPLLMVAGMSDMSPASRKR